MPLSVGFFAKNVGFFPSHFRPFRHSFPPSLFAFLMPAHMAPAAPPHPPARPAVGVPAVASMVPASPPHPPARPAVGVPADASKNAASPPRPPARPYSIASLCFNAGFAPFRFAHGLNFLKSY